MCFRLVNKELTSLPYCEYAFVVDADALLLHLYLK